jgi:hypothetical protein
MKYPYRNMLFNMLFLAAVAYFCGVDWAALMVCIGVSLFWPFIGQTMVEVGKSRERIALLEAKIEKLQTG